MEDYVSFEQAKALKELGFDWECNHYYQDNNQSIHPNFYEDFNKHKKLEYTKDGVLVKVDLCSAATLAQAAKWLRDVKGIALNIIADKEREFKERFYYSEVYLSNFKEKGYKWYDYHSHPLVDSYEQALSDGLDWILNLLKEE